MGDNWKIISVLVGGVLILGSLGLTPYAFAGASSSELFLNQEGFAFADASVFNPSDPSITGEETHQGGIYPDGISTFMPGEISNPSLVAPNNLFASLEAVSDGSGGFDVTFGFASENDSTPLFSNSIDPSGFFPGGQFEVAELYSNSGDPISIDSCSTFLNDSEVNHFLDVIGDGTPGNPLIFLFAISSDDMNSINPVIFSAFCDFSIETSSDTEDPVITCPADITIPEGDSTTPSNTGEATATDNSGVNPVITYSDVESDGQIVRTWEAQDAAGNTDSCDQIITILSPEERIDNLLGDVENLGLSNKDENSLSKKLNSANKELKNEDEYDDYNACEKLEAFINKLNSLVKSNKLDRGQADQLINEAQNIINDICIPSKIIFQRLLTNEGYDIYSMNPDGTDWLRLTDNGILHDFYPSWSPDGTKIAFSSSRDLNGGNEIYVMNADGTDQTRLTFTNVVQGLQPQNWDPTWSPDGKQIAFTSTRDGNGEIYVMNVDGSDQTRLIFDTTGTWRPSDQNASWSPDGSKIAFQRLLTNEGYDIYVMNADGSNWVRLTDNGLPNDFDPSFSPDGTKIAYTSGRDLTGGTEIYVMNADGTDKTRLTVTKSWRNLPPLSEAPTWSPDGKQIAFTSHRTGNGEIYVMNADGTDQTRIIFDYASWKPHDQNANWQRISD